MFPNRIRAISTPRLNTLRCLHPAPINLVISYGSLIPFDGTTIPNLGVGFILRCFQNLSVPDLATLRCPWQDSRHTRGRFNSVLSSRHSPVTRSADYIFILRQAQDKSLTWIGCWRITRASRHFLRSDSPMHKSVI